MAAAKRGHGPRGEPEWSAGKGASFEGEPVFIGEVRLSLSLSLSAPSFGLALYDRGGFTSLRSVTCEREGKKHLFHRLPSSTNGHTAIQERRGRASLDCLLSTSPPSPSDRRRLLCDDQNNSLTPTKGKPRFFLLPPLTNMAARWLLRTDISVPTYGRAGREFHIGVSLSLSVVDLLWVTSSRPASRPASQRFPRDVSRPERFLHRSSSAASSFLRFHSSRIVQWRYTSEKEQEVGHHISFPLSYGKCKDLGQKYFAFRIAHSLDRSRVFLCSLLGIVQPFRSSL